jgi:uncharacterized protein Yka (UPF0111/DUF47 family)
MLNNVMPHRSSFFNLLAAHTDRLLAGAGATLRLITGLGSQGEQSEALIDEVNLNESSADGIKAEFIKLLYESFTTPINRDQLHTLILDLDRVLDTLQSVANAILMYNIRDSTPEARALAALASDACLRINRAVIALEDRKQATKIAVLCPEIDALKSQASAVMREAVTKLFRDEGDEQAAWHAMKMRRFYFTQVAVLDGCKRAGRTMEEILLENA